MALFDRGIELKTPAQFELMRKAGQIVAGALELCRQEIKAGMTTAAVDALAENYIRKHHAIPSFKGYHGFPATLCISINDEVVHGIPGTKVIKTGDLVSIDCGAIVAGFHGDAAITVGVGEISETDQALLVATEASMWAGIQAAKVGGKVTDISHAVEQSIRNSGTYGILEDYVGHGIGSALHQPPNVPNLGLPGRGPKLKVGMALAIEPMITLGSAEVFTHDDEWTVSTEDKSRAAHFEHTIGFTESGVEVFTQLAS